MIRDVTIIGGEIARLTGTELYGKVWRGSSGYRQLLRGLVWWMMKEML